MEAEVCFCSLAYSSLSQDIRPSNTELQLMSRVCHAAICSVVEKISEVKMISV